MEGRESGGTRRGGEGGMHLCWTQTTRYTILRKIFLSDLLPYFFAFEFSSLLTKLKHIILQF